MLIGTADDSEDDLLWNGRGGGVCQYAACGGEQPSSCFESDDDIIAGSGHRPVLFSGGLDRLERA